MPITDVFDRPYARLSNLKENDRVICDDGFPCMKAWSEHSVISATETQHGELCILCSDGLHSLDGQLDDNTDALIGIYPADGFIFRPGER